MANAQWGNYLTYLLPIPIPYSTHSFCDRKYYLSTFQFLFFMLFIALFFADQLSILLGLYTLEPGPFIFWMLPVAIL